MDVKSSFELNESAIDILYMQRALELALLGRGHVAPNPLVGCVIVHERKIIGEGWHRRWGDAHAEVNAVQSVTDRALLKNSTVYVTLEPCSHFGKTPPCADLLIRESVKKVVVACQDPNPLVAGKGIQKLRNAGIEVVSGVLEKEARYLNKGFINLHERKRPYVILKWAQTSDGFIARDDFNSKWISDDYSRQLVHKWRAEETAILVGPNTVRYDNPRLNVREWTGKDPIRVVLDRNNTLNEDFHVFDRSQSTLYYNTNFEAMADKLILVKVQSDNCIQNVLDDLKQRNIQSVLVEGGSGILNAFLGEGLWDEIRLFVAPVEFGKGIPAPRINCPFTEYKFRKDTLRISFNPLSQAINHS